MESGLGIFKRSPGNSNVQPRLRNTGLGRDGEDAKGHRRDNSTEESLGCGMERGMEGVSLQERQFQGNVAVFGGLKGCGCSNLLHVCRIKTSNEGSLDKGRNLKQFKMYSNNIDSFVRQLSKRKHWKMSNIVLFLIQYYKFVQISHLL